MPEKNETNKVRLIGEVVSEFTFNHEVFGEKFYFVSLSVTRLSGQVDVIPISISERLMDISKDYRGTTMEVLGQFRSYNRHDGEKSHLILFVFAQFDSWKSLLDILERIRFSWTDTSVRNLSIGGHRWEEKLQICFWRLIDYAEKQIIYRVSYGAEMPAMHPVLM